MSLIPVLFVQFDTESACAYHHGTVIVATTLNIFTIC